MMNVCFLDIDSTLNHGHFGKDENDKFGFADDCIANLKLIINKIPDLRFVITSAWQHFVMQGLVDQDTKDWRQSLCDKLGVSRDIIIGDCPDANGSRAEGIAVWLDANKTKVGLGTYVILDDECTALREMFPNNVVDCGTKTGEGLSERKANEAIKILTNLLKDSFIN